MDKGAAKSALSGFLIGKNLTANQIVLLDQVVNYLAQRGWVSVGQLYESPFTDVHHNGVSGVFDELSTEALLMALNTVRQNALGQQRSS
jgi:type I restriction enzyme R subunit